MITRRSQCKHSRRAYHARGSAALEFTVATMVLILLSLSSIEVARWHSTRQILHLALHEAARAGAVSHADPTQLRAAFLQALLPLHGAGLQALSRQNKVLTTISQQMATHPWRIEVLMPSTHAFDLFSRPKQGIATHPTLRVIDNNYQALQYARRNDTHALTIFEANTLRLRLTYLSQPALPPLRLLLKTLGHTGQHYAAHAMAQGLLPIVIELQIDMHSHPVDWSAQPSTPETWGVVYGACRRLQCV